MIGKAGLILAVLFSLGAGMQPERTIVLNAVVDAPPDRVYELWTTAEETKRFFGADAVIDLRPGGAYEIFFAPRGTPQSDANSTRGARILKLVPGREISFEWGMPPFAAELNRSAPRTWVDVEIEPQAAAPGKSHVRVTHRGFQRGEKWDRAYEFFVRGWGDILYRLESVCAAGGA